MKNRMLLENKEIARMMKLSNNGKHTKRFLFESSKCSDCGKSPCECDGDAESDDVVEESENSDLTLKKGTFPQSSKGSAGTKIPMGNNDGKLKPLSTSTKNTQKHTKVNMPSKKPELGLHVKTPVNESKEDRDIRRILQEISQDMSQEDDEEFPQDQSMEQDPNQMDQEMPDMDQEEVPEMGSEGGNKDQLMQFLSKVAQAATEVWGIPVEVSGDEGQEENPEEEMPQDEEMPDMDQEEMPQEPVEEDPMEQKMKNSQQTMQERNYRNKVHNMTLEILKEMKKKRVAAKKNSNRRQ